MTGQRCFLRAAAGHAAPHLIGERAAVSADYFCASFFDVAAAPVQGTVVCSRRTMQTVPIVVAPTEEGPYGIAIDQSWLYWAAASGDIRKRIIQSDAPPATTLASNQGTAFDLAVDATHVYFTTLEGRVARVPKEGGSVETLVSGQPGPREIALDGEAVYWANHGLFEDTTLVEPGSIMKVAK